MIDQTAAWITLATLALVLGLLVFTRLAPYLVMMGALALLFTVGVIGEKEVLAGASNPGVAAVAVLFLVVAGLRETGAMDWLVGPLLGRPNSLTGAQARMMLPVGGLSAFMNNTPLVAVMLPVVNDWSRKIGISSSRLLMPLSFASILGGMCTLIGTSTTVVVDGLMRQTPGLHGMSMFTIGAIGLPIALAGMVLIVVSARWLLPDRKPAISPQDDVRQYTVEMMVDAGSPLAGKTIEQAGLRHLPGLFLVEIDREGQVMAAPSSSVALNAGDRLIFAGIVESVVDLQKIRGLVPATRQVFKLDSARTNRVLLEAVVSDTCPLVGRTIREGKFRSRYNAAVIAVARNGERVQKKIGDIRLRTGDTLLLEARASFADQQRNSRDFYLVSAIEGSAPVRHDKAPMALGILLAMVVAASYEPIGVLKAAMLAAGAMLVTRCCNAAAAMRAIDWQLILAIVGAFGLGKAMETSGLAGMLAGNVLDAAHSPHLALGVILLLTTVFTNLMTNNAAAVLMFPIAMQTAEKLQAAPMPFVMAIAVSASCSFLTPIGYQTNLMVYGPGGYRFGDYFRLGVPLSAVVLGMAWWGIPLIWAF